MKTTEEGLISLGFVHNKNRDSFDLQIVGCGLLSIEPGDYSFFIGADHSELGYTCSTSACLDTIDKVENLIHCLTGKKD